MAVSIEDHSFEISNKSDSSFDIRSAVKNLNAAMQKNLKPMEWQVYEMLYIEQKSEEQVCKVLKLKFDKNSKTGYNKQLKNIQKMIIKKAKNLIASGEVDV
jgi:hypothetical protein